LLLLGALSAFVAATILLSGSAAGSAIDLLAELRGGADDPAPRMPRRAMPRIDPARIATAELAAMWHGYPPITDPSEIQKLRDSLQ
jgi:hypothetical protein